MIEIKLYLLAYDNNAYRETIGIETKLKTSVTSIKRVTDSSFLIKSDKTSKELFESVANLLIRQTQFIFLEIGDNCYGLPCDLNTLIEMEDIK